MPSSNIPEETSAEEFLYSVFFSIIAEGSHRAFEHAQFECQSEEFRALFEYEFGIFCLWTLSFFAKHRDEFGNVERLGETVCRALVRSLDNVLDEPSETLERRYNEVIRRFEEMDDDMLSDGRLSNLTVGVSARICKGRMGEDFFKCMELTTESFVVLTKKHAQALQSVRIVRDMIRTSPPTSHVQEKEVDSKAQIKEITWTVNAGVTSYISVNDMIFREAATLRSLLRIFSDLACQ
jgi:hypothetical protein